MKREILQSAAAVLCLAAAVAAAGPSHAQGKAKKPAGKPAPAAAAAAAAAPAAAKLKTTELPDGTGTIGVPDGWNITEAYRGTVFVRGPQKQLVTMGHAFVISRPNHPAHQLGIPTDAPFAPDGDLVGALKGVLAKANNRLISLRAMPAPSGTPGVPAVFFSYEVEAHGTQFAAIGYFTSIGAGDDQTLPYWQLYVSAVIAPKEIFMKELPTMMAMWKSWQPNGQKPKEGSAGAMIDEAIKDSTRRRAQTLKEQQAAYDRMNEKFKQTIMQ